MEDKVEEELAKNNSESEKSQVDGSKSQVIIRVPTSKALEYHKSAIELKDTLKHRNWTDAEIDAEIEKLKTEDEQVK